MDKWHIIIVIVFAAMLVASFFAVRYSQSQSFEQGFLVGNSSVKQPFLFVSYYQPETNGTCNNTMPLYFQEPKPVTVVDNGTLKPVFQWVVAFHKSEWSCSQDSVQPHWCRCLPTNITGA